MAKESGKTERTAAVKLLRLSRIMAFDSLRLDPKDDLWSSWSEITLQSSLPGAEPVEQKEPGENGGVGCSCRDVDCSGSSSCSISIEGRLISERAYSMSR